MARFAGTGCQHANDCRYYAPAPDRSGMQGYEPGVVEEGDYGSLRIRLARGIRMQDASPPAEEATDALAPTRPGVSKPAMTLLGLLHLLWSESRLTTWYPAMEGKRTAGIVNHVLRETAVRILASRLKLSEVMMLAASKDSRESSRNQGTALNPSTLACV